MKKIANPNKIETEVTRRNVSNIAEMERKAQLNRTTGDRFAEQITRFCGSMLFVWVHIVWFVAWVLLNTVSPLTKFDPFPFNFLTLAVSLEAIFLSTFILISENTRSRIDERRNHLDLQINLLAEQENTKMLELLHQIALKVGIDCNDKILVALEKNTQPDKLMEQIEALQFEESKSKPD